MQSLPETEESQILRNFSIFLQIFRKKLVKVMIESKWKIGLKASEA